MRLVSRALVVAAVSVALVVLFLARSTTTDRPSASLASPPVSSPVAPAGAVSAEVDPFRYAALGDSYTAGPGIPEQETTEPMCRRSSDNYPAQVAAALDARLADASCGGARARNLTTRRPAPGSQGQAQLRGIDRRTNLITVGVGANEFGLFSRIFGDCAEGGACRVEGLRRDARRVARTTERVLVRVSRAVPDARILLVGYPRMLPASGTCRVLPFSAEEARQLRAVWARVNTSLRRAAREVGVEYVDPYPASNKHHVCSRSPWINGSRTDRGEGTTYHPTPEGMAGLARLVLRQIRSGS